MQAEPGAVSNGTLRTQDLVMSFMNVLESLDTDRDYTDLIDEASLALKKFDHTEFDPSRCIEPLQIVLDELFEVLDTFSPEGHQFSAHENDGASFGWWESPVEDDEK